MAGTIELPNKSYGPAPIYIRQGGTMYHRFEVSFAGAAPPTEFTYTVRLKNAGGTVKTITGTLPTDGQALVPVVVHSDLAKDAGGPLDFGNYATEFEASAPGFGTRTELFCTGTPVEPEECECDPSCDV